MERKNPSIAMVPSPGFSHLLPFIEFSKRLVFHHPHFQVAFFIPMLGPPSPAAQSIFQSLPPNIEFTLLPQINMDDHKTSDQLTIMQRTVSLSLPSLHQALSSFSSRTHFVAMVADLFSTEVLDITKQLKLKSYVFYSSSATSLSFVLHFPILDEDHERFPTGFRELSQPLKLPGCISFHGKDLPDPAFERSSETYKTVLYLWKRFYLADGIIVNSFLDLELGPITALQDTKHNQPSVYPVGPITQNGSSTSKGSTSECLTWLDDQPKNSVLYVSFGSGGTLSYDQLQELALGLEMSGHKFLWVVRAPTEQASAAYYLSTQKRDPLDYLPEGFINRTKGQGFVVPSWAPQIEVLRHEATGGFLTHCGWNSTLEGLVSGKPMIAWPLFAEQRMTAVMMTEEFKVAVRPKGDENENGIVKREEVARVVKIIMEGDEGREIRRRTQVFKEAAANAFSEDGSSTKTLSNLALEWEKLSGE